MNKFIRYILLIFVIIFAIRPEIGISANKMITSSHRRAGWIPYTPIGDNENNNIMFCVIDLSDGPSAQSYPVTYISGFSSEMFNAEEYKTSKIVLRLIQAGTYIFGFNQSDESHRVNITKSFYLCLFETTQKQYELVTGTNPSIGAGRPIGDAYPVYRAPYNTIRGSNLGTKWPASDEVDPYSFFGLLRQKTGLKFDLPTRAQWEYACRAGTSSAYSYGDSPDGDYMWYYLNSGYDPHIVGLKLPNPWGLYDMHGNQHELCLDWDGSYYYNGDDPKGPSTGSGRCALGGCWGNDESAQCSSNCEPISPTSLNDGNGFRISLTID